MNIILGLMVIATVIISGFYLERQAFHRHNSASMQEFERYGESVKVRLKEGIMKIVSVISGLAGIVLIVTTLI